LKPGALCARFTDHVFPKPRARVDVCAHAHGHARHPDAEKNKPVGVLTSSRNLKNLPTQLCKQG
jgi:hypothetical protein